MGNKGLKSALCSAHGNQVGQLRDEHGETLDTLFYFGPCRKNTDKPFRRFASQMKTERICNWFSKVACPIKSKRGIQYKEETQSSVKSCEKHF